MPKKAEQFEVRPGDVVIRRAPVVGLCELTGGPEELHGIFVILIRKEGYVWDYLPVVPEWVRWAEEGGMGNERDGPLSFVPEILRPGDFDGDIDLTDPCLDVDLAGEVDEIFD